MVNSGTDEQGPEGLQLELLGTARLVRNGAVVQLLEPKDAALLALLVVEGPTARSRAATLIWPDSEPSRAGGSLRQRLFRLKRAAGQDVVVGDRQITLAPPVSHDLGAFTDRVLQDSARGFGELLGNADYGDHGELGAWVQGARAQWRAARRQALAEAASRLESQGALAQALALSERLVLDDPAAEHAHRRVMRLHYLRGDRAAALAAFERCAELLQREIGASPGKETRQLAATIESSAALKQALPGSPQPLPATLRRPPQLVGREAQWRQLEIQACRTGVVLVEGEPGSGKSRLLNDFAQAQGWPAPVGARPGDEAVPYALAARWIAGLAAHFPVPLERSLRGELAHLVPRLADPLQPPQGRLEPARLRLAVESALARWHAVAQGGPSGAGPGLAIDDLQFADDASVELLLALASRSSSDSAAWTWVLAFRAGTLPESVARWQAASESRGPVLLQLAPLDEPAVQGLLASLQLPGMVPARWAAPLLHHCGGFPFAVIDTLADLHAQGQHDFSQAPVLPVPSPQRLGAIVRRLEQLSAEARQLAQVAAAAGQDFDVDLAASVLGCAPVALAAPWRTLEQAGLFRGGGFAHDLVRQAALEALPEAIARVIHRQIAQWLARAGEAPGAPRGARMAAHWEAAHEWPLAARSHERAAEEARARSAAREELQALDAAARCHRLDPQPGSDEAAFDCEWRGVGLTLVLGSTDAALDRAEALAERAQTDHQRAAALVARSQVRSERYESDMAWDDAQSAARRAAAAGSERMQVLAAQRLAVALTRLSRPDEALSALNGIQAPFDHLDDEERLLWLSDHATALDCADRRVEALDMFDRVITQAQTLGRWGAASEAWGNKAIALMYLGRTQASFEASQRTLECDQRAGAERGNMLIDQMSMAGSLRDLGQFADYLQMAETLPQALREAGYPVWAFNAENDLAICFAWLGRPELAQQALSPVPDDLLPMMRAARLFIQARLLRGRAWGSGVIAHPQAAELVRRAHDLIEASGSGGRSHVRLRVALELVRDDEPAAALASVARIEAEARQRELGMLAMHALCLRTELNMMTGAVDAAAAAAGDLLDRCALDGPPPSLYTPELYWLAHRALAPVDAERSRHALDLAHRWIQNVAMPQMPPAFHRSFRERNPVNAAVLAAVR